MWFQVRETDCYIKPSKNLKLLTVIKFSIFSSMYKTLLFCIFNRFKNYYFELIIQFFFFDSINVNIFLSKNANAIVSDVKYHKWPEYCFIVMFDITVSIFSYNIRLLKSSKSKLGAKAATGDENQYLT